MPNGDPRDGFFYPNLTLMIDSYIMRASKALLELGRYTGSARLSLDCSPMQYVCKNCAGSLFFN